MVVLVSFLLVLAAAVTLVVGLLQSGLTLIYLSIGCSVVAGLVLAVAVLRGRPEPKAAAVRPGPALQPAAGPAYSSPSYSSSSHRSEPEPADESVEGRHARPRHPPLRPSGRRRRRGAGRGAGAVPRRRLRPPGGRRRVRPPSPSVISSEMPGRSARGGFPIPDFDELRAPELLRRLDELDAAQLEQVREREAAGKDRVSILSRIDARLETLREPGWEIDEATWEGGDAARRPRPRPRPTSTRATTSRTSAEPAPRLPPAATSPSPATTACGWARSCPCCATSTTPSWTRSASTRPAGKARSGILDRIDFLAGGGTRPTVTAAPPPPARPGRRPRPRRPRPRPAKAAGSTSIAAAVAAAKAKQAKKG